MPCGLFHFQTLDVCICRFSGVLFRLVYYIYFISRRNTHLSNENSADSDQTPQHAASDLSLHCLPISLLWDMLFPFYGTCYFPFMGHLAFIGLQNSAEKSIPI